MVVPNGWTIKPIEQIMRIRKERINPQAFISTRCIELEHIEPISGRLLGWIESNIQRSQKAVFTTGDVLFGKLRPYLRKYYYPSFDGICSTEFWVLTALDNSVDNSYIYYIVQTNRFLETANSTTGTKMPRTDWSLMKEVSFSIPLSLTEQRAITTALSDADKYITALEKLIAKKRAVKQGAMQELLSGKRRLPGFEGEKVEKELVTLCDTFCDGDWIETKDQSDDGIRLIQTGNVGNGCFLNKSGKKRFISEITFSNLNCTEVYTNDVLVSRLPNPAGRACIVPNQIGKAITAVDCTIIRFNKYNAMLFVMFSQTEQYQRQIDLLLAGSTRQRISRKELGMIKVPYFESNEQTAIAAVLSDMDAEINALTAKLEKSRRIKQGMMSELLTGRIRLIKEKTDNGEN